ncbi:hypothetical protein DICPUDRAFT_57796 [Dictyostelium purpureum]|uniref:Amidohydrolase-related domain-containing protein n=1 Tax=Dictyostelium purpureum TaxID=5786 RepID=F0ZXS8_DICPU|nr:uncharacterized protein DICPUDRAFT_57796 [Dictyostelium purpureum]EGC31250.1 hypothetical protein DICPUDRAFT_57796 [Dictyostelium purpureum]|eukprot:XP_003292228.1 hypothetical protein DICPUDRAFT_57796 [Dictyostelium purpureum]
MENNSNTTDTTAANALAIVDADFAVVAKWIIPVIPENTVYENHCLVVKDEKILDIVRFSDLEMRYNVKNVINLKEMNSDNSSSVNSTSEYILAPGFFNMHSHSAMSLLRGYADDVSLHDWLTKFIWPAEAQYVSEEFVKVGTELACLEMIKTGTTYCNDMYFYPEVAAKVYESFGMRATVAAPIIKFPTVYAKTEAEYIEKGITLIENYRNNSKIKISLGPHAVYTITDEAYIKVKELSEKYNIKIHTHLHETCHEVSEEIKAVGKRPIDRLRDLSVLSPSLIAAHMTQLTKEDIDLTAKSGIHVVHCPESNLKLGVKGVSPVHKLLKLGINVSIGTDSAASNDDLDMLGEMRTAAYIDKLSSNTHTPEGGESVTPSYKMLAMSTINGAKALGVDDKLGSLQIGKLADFIAVKVSSHPVYDPISHLVYVGTNHVTDVWVSGKQLLRNSRLTTVNENQLKSKVIEYQHKINSTRPKTNLKIIN